MDVWRLTRAKHRDHALDGVGARIAGNRWNSKGVAMAYTSSSLELAVLESMMHLTLSQIPSDYIWLQYRLPDDAVDNLKSVPDGWDSAGPPYDPAIQKIGDEWIAEKTSLALQVPAAVLPLRRNVLINPQHLRFPEIELVDEGPFTWPKRLLVKIAK